MRNIVLLCVALLAGCTAKHIGPQAVENTDPKSINGRKILLLNEGNFGRGNSSISAYVATEKKVYHQLYSGANDGLRLGDVGQSISGYAHYLYVAVNASGYIAVIDTIEMRISDSITGSMVAPRYMAMKDGVCYLTDLFSNKLWMIDLQTNQEVGNIDLPNAGKYVMVWGGMIVVSTGDALVFHKPNQQDTLIDMGSTVQGLVKSSDGALWVLTQGNSNEPAELIRYSENTFNSQSFVVSNNDPGYLGIHPSSGSLYYVENDGIYRAKYDDSRLAVNRIYPLQGENVYTLEVDPISGDIYLVDALDFDQASEVYRIDSNGILLDQFKAGIITSDFYFGL